MTALPARTTRSPAGLHRRPTLLLPTQSLRVLDHQQDNLVLRMASRPSPRRWTHFLCIPLVNDTSRPQLQSSLQHFASNVFEKPPFDEMPMDRRQLWEKAVRPLGTIHLTLGVMDLADPSRLEDAKKLLQQLDLRSMMDVTAVRETAPRPIGDLDEVVPTPMPPILVTLRSVLTMPPAPPHRTGILWTQPQEPTDRLGPLSVKLTRAFQDAGLMPDGNGPLLHATLLNTKYIGRHSKGIMTRKLTLDATEIIKQYDGFMFAQDVPLDTIAICEMGVKKILDPDGNILDEEYEVVASRGLVPASIPCNKPDE